MEKMNKRFIAWLISTIYMLCIGGGILFLLDVENKVESMTMAGIALATIVIPFFVFKEIELKKAFMVAGIVMLNYSLFNYWGEMTQGWRIISFVIWGVELVVILVAIYNNLSNKTFFTKRRPMRYVNRTSAQPTSAEVNVNQFCKSKFADKDKIDNCIADLLGGNTP